MLTEDLEVPVVEPIDAKIVRLVCELVGKRAAYLIGAGIVFVNTFFYLFFKKDKLF